MISPMEAQGYYCLWHVCSCLCIFMHLGLCCLQQKVVLITVFHNKWDHLVNRTAGKISRFEKWPEKKKKKELRKCKKRDRLHDSVRHVCEFSVSEWVFPSVSRSTWHFQKLHSRSLHILSSSSPLPAHCSRHLVPRTSSFALLEHWLLHIMRWKDHWRSRTLVRVAQKNR